MNNILLIACFISAMLSSAVCVVCSREARSALLYALTATNPQAAEFYMQEHKRMRKWVIISAIAFGVFFFAYTGIYFRPGQLK